MRARVKEGCTGCGLCEAICPEVFRINNDGLAEAFSEVTAETIDNVREAAESCPVSVIEIEEV